MRNGKIFEPGKLPMDLLNELLTKYAVQDESVIVGPGIGNDAAVIQIGENYLVLKTDPITFTAKDIGYYAIQINANDIACLGGIPKWLLVTLLLPEKRTTAEKVENIFKQLSQVCHEMKISICGGHTEITRGIERPILVGQMVGTVTREKLVRPSGIQIGDDIILTKGIAIEGSSIIAREKYKEISNFFSKDFAQRCADFIYQPGISILREAQLAQNVAPIHAMHDPTEGGIAMGLHEFARASNVTLHIDMNKIPILPESKLLCDEYGLDILGVIASGALLLAVPARYSQQLIERFDETGIPTAIIGKAISKGADVRLVLNDEVIEMPVFYKDEILKLV